MQTGVLPPFRLRGVFQSVNMEVVRLTRFAVQKRSPARRIHGMQNVAHLLTQIGIVVHNQYCPAHQSPSFRASPVSGPSFAAGSLTRKSVHSPSRESTVMRPPCSWTILLTTASPSPVPPDPFVE